VYTGPSPEAALTLESGRSFLALTLESGRSFLALALHTGRRSGDALTLTLSQQERES
jgi:hypothetical protein